MAKKPAAPEGERPLLHVRDWLSQQIDLPAEAVAGFLHHVAADAWDTADHWRQRWEAWLHHPVGQ
ncbi:hypothetical protein [Sulfobacillus harzensis]|uniref:Uncharacterized protein n=1 Tax=Sulfobacillus harzensis TaxID=2729629 RepID=A0A7Y0L056_9FIRM|nr:hypothetical protein [Sulfobacillus harzensis]NMP20770.1 hypothetical protein [Sulfobacillus harzensis]